MNLRRHFASVVGGMRGLTGIAFAAATLVPLPPVWSQTPKHPLDGLTPSEIWTAYEVLRASNKVDADTRFPMVQLNEPPKEEILAWKPGQGMRREAFLEVSQGAQIFEAVVDVNGSKLISWTEKQGVQANLPHEAEGEMSDAVKAIPEVQNALKLRNITDPWNVACSGAPEGNFNTGEEKGRRLLRVVCFKEFGALENWSPISGLSIIWDENAKKALRVVDTGAVPLVRADRNYSGATTAKTRAANSPMTIQQPSGPGFQLDGQTVNWQNWKFHFRIDRRVGLVVSNVAYQDGDKLRRFFMKDRFRSCSWRTKTQARIGSGQHSSILEKAAAASPARSSRVPIAPITLSTSTRPTLTGTEFRS